MKSLFLANAMYAAEKEKKKPETLQEYAGSGLNADGCVLFA